MGLRIYHYPGCSTCRSARKWLDARGIAYEAIDLVASPPSAATLAELARRSGQPFRKLFNTSGESYRTGGFRDRLPSMSPEEAFSALAADGKLVKRPILDGGAFVLLGFREPEYEQWIGSGA